MVVACLVDMVLGTVAILHMMDHVQVYNRNAAFSDA
jgi:hypothetical protein